MLQSIQTCPGVTSAGAAPQEKHADLKAEVAWHEEQRQRERERERSAGEGQEVEPPPASPPRRSRPASPGARPTPAAPSLLF